MSETSQQKLKPSVWWVLPWAVVLWHLAWAGVGVYTWPGVGEIDRFVYPALFCGAMSLPVVLIWIAITSAVFWSYKIQMGRLRAVLMLSPALLLGGYVGVRSVANPPSPHAFFSRKVGCELPANARDIKLHGNFVQDWGTVYYYFRSSEAETRRLIECLKMSEVAIEAAELWLPIIQDRLPGVPDAEWAARCFYFRNGKTGMEMYLITDAALNEAFFMREPGASKTDEELGPETAAAMYPKESR